MAREVAVERELVDRRESAGNAEVQHVVAIAEQPLHDPIERGIVVVAPALHEGVAEERDLRGARSGSRGPSCRSCSCGIGRESRSPGDRPRGLGSATRPSSGSRRETARSDDRAGETARSREGGAPVRSPRVTASRRRARGRPGPRARRRAISTSTGSPAARVQLPRRPPATIPPFPKHRDGVGAARCHLVSTPRRA